MPLTILSDANVRSLLDTLTKDDVNELQQSLADALHYYSTATEAEGNSCCASNQPSRTALKRNDGQTTLFMPASGTDGLGVKIVTLLAPPDGKPTAGLQSAMSSLSMDSPEGASSPSSTTDPSSGSRNSSLKSSNATQSSTSSSQTTLDTHTESTPAQEETPSNTTPRGFLSLLDRNGNARALINAEEITAFRTALASTMLLRKRKNVHDLTVFGAGKQAYWHIRLALLLRPGEIHHINVVNRSFEHARNMIMRLKGVLEDDVKQPNFEILTTGHREYETHLKPLVRNASVIFCTTPSLEPLFPARYLTNPEGRKKGRYIVAIGSYKPNMIEIHPDVVRQAVRPEHQHHHHHHKHAKTGGAIVVDSVEACLREAGEVIQAGLSGRELVELGELVMLKRDAERRTREASGTSETSAENEGVSLNENSEGDLKGLGEWLQRGNVIFKCVGMGLMDVTVGADLVRLADGKGIGTRIEDF